MIPFNLIPVSPEKAENIAHAQRMARSRALQYISRGMIQGLTVDQLVEATGLFETPYERDAWAKHLEDLAKKFPSYDKAKFDAEIDEWLASLRAHMSSGKPLTSVLHIDSYQAPARIVEYRGEDVAEIGEEPPKDNNHRVKRDAEHRKRENAHKARGSLARLLGWA